MLKVYGWRDRYQQTSQEIECHEGHNPLRGVQEVRNMNGFPRR